MKKKLNPKYSDIVEELDAIYMFVKLSDLRTEACIKFEDCYGYDEYYLNFFYGVKQFIIRFFIGQVLSLIIKNENEESDVNSEFREISMEAWRQKEIMKEFKEILNKNMQGLE